MFVCLTASLFLLAGLAWLARAKHEPVLPCFTRYPLDGTIKIWLNGVKAVPFLVTQTVAELEQLLGASSYKVLPGTRTHACAHAHTQSPQQNWEDVRAVSLV